MKKETFFKAVGLTLTALFFELLELLYLVGRALIKWLIIAIILIPKASVFLILLPFSAWKCAARTARQRSFAAGAQLAKWIWLDYWKGFKL